MGKNGDGRKEWMGEKQRMGEKHSGLGKKMVGLKEVRSWKERG